MTKAAKEMDAAQPWIATTLRASAFLKEPARAMAEGLWAALTDEQPDKTQTEPKRSLYREVGKHQGRQLTVLAQDKRLDILFAVDQSLDEESEHALAPTDELPEAITKFAELSNTWIPLLNHPMRLALGATLQQEVSSRQESYHKLQEFLKGLEIDPENSSDLVYRINRPRAVSLQSQLLRVNRLSTWSALSLVSVGFEVDLRTTSSSALVAPHTYVAQLELDINTDPAFQGEIAQADARRIFDTLVEYGLEIARQGDIP